MTKANSLKQVPFGTHRFWDGDKAQERRALLEYVGSWEKNVEWRPNEPFIATLTLDRLERGRSAARFWFLDNEGTEYPFFGQGLTEMLQQVELDHGVVTGTWIAVKRGANYGLELFEDPK